MDYSKKEDISESQEVVEDGIAWSANEIQAQSTTNIESDEGTGGVAIIRCFEFGANVESFRQKQPTSQELFNSHLRGIEILLWKDGMSIITEVEPRVVFDKENLKYKIFVGAKPAKGHILREKPQTLSEVINSR